MVIYTKFPLSIMPAVNNYKTIAGNDLNNGLLQRLVVNDKKQEPFCGILNQFVSWFLRLV